MNEKLVYLCLGALGCLVFIWMAWACFQNGHPRPPQWGVVDMHALVAYQSRQLAKTTRKGKVSARQLQEATTHLKEVLGGFAEERNIFLLDKGVLAGGSLPDHTVDLLAILEQETQQQGQPEEQQGGGNGQP